MQRRGRRARMCRRFAPVLHGRTHGCAANPLCDE
jgi:hypothetical protein